MDVQAQDQQAKIALDVGLSYSATYMIIDRFEAGGATALARRIRGRRVGGKRELRAEQETNEPQTSPSEDLRGER